MKKCRDCYYSEMYLETLNLPSSMISVLVRSYMQCCGLFFPLQSSKFKIKICNKTLIVTKNDEIEIELNELLLNELINK